MNRNLLDFNLIFSELWIPGQFSAAGKLIFLLVNVCDVLLGSSDLHVAAASC